MSETGDDPRYPVHAPGWAALDRALGVLYPGQTPHQFASQRAYDLEGHSPLPAVVAYEATGPDHWHLVGYGLSELFEKSSPDPEHSGFGFELGLRLPRAPGQERPPAWAVQLLQALGHYVLSGHHALDSGHVIDLGGPLAPPMADAAERPTALEGVVCVPDPQLGKVDTPHGSVLLLLLFGLTRDELEAMGEWDLKRKVGLVREAAPLAITDPRRGSMREDPRRSTLFRRYELGIMI
ncbi:MAG: suppressor of fused domain protein [Myxococcales bacterium]|nr:suppressor of fused domain protein [Myxococcales bacterium]MCB9718176.1 suppressor of fused domain protein [Myxococcales bacterium]